MDPACCPAAPTSAVTSMVAMTTRQADLHQLTMTAVPPRLEARGTAVGHEGARDGTLTQRTGSVPRLRLVLARNDRGAHEAATLGRYCEGDVKQEWLRREGNLRIRSRRPCSRCVGARAAI